jgi:hypothetical protein
MISTHPVGHNREIARLQREIFPGGDGRWNFASSSGGAVRLAAIQHFHRQATRLL